MIKTICDRCGKVLDTNGKKDHFIIHSSDLCHNCFREYQVLLEEFLYKKKQTTGGSNDDSK